MTVCPNCGHVFRGRAAAGEGTQYGPDGRHISQIPISENEVRMLEILKGAQGAYNGSVTVRQVLGYIFNCNLKRSKGNNWNAHTTQATLSLLVGRKMIHARQMDNGTALIYWR